MMRRLLLSYAVVELIVLIGLAATIGVGWTLLVLLATFVLGLVLWAPLAGWQLSSQIAQLRLGLREPRVALSDGALVALASGLILVPGLATTAAGPVAAGAADTGGRPTRIGRDRDAQVRRRMPLVTGTSAVAGRRGDFIDGEVIDVTDFEPPVLPGRT